MRTFFLTALSSLVMSLAFAMPSLVSATNPTDAFKSVVEKSDLVEEGGAIPEADSVVASIIGNVLLYVGILVLALIVYAGFLWATARGNDEQIKKAKQILVGSIIGLIIIFTSSAIVDFVLTDVLINAVS